MVVWTREPALGYPKHPPLLAWVLWAWFRIFPLADWSYILLAVITVAGGIYLAVELSAQFLSREKLAAVPFLLAAIPFYNFLGLKFDQNSTLIPLWALATWAMLRALDTRRLGWAALAGIVAAAAMLTKYWSFFLIAALSLAALVHPKRRAYFRSGAPWVTAGLFATALAPHVVWLVRENFPPLTWVATRRISAGLADTLASLAEYLAGTAGYASIALILVAVLVRPTVAAIRDSWFPRDERRTAAALFWTPLLLPVVPALIKNISLLSLWSTPALNLMPVMMLASPKVTVPRVAVLRIAGVITAVTLFIVLISPVIAFVILKTGVENNAAYARLIMRAAEQEWHKTIDRPLKMIAGPFVLVSSAAFYGTDRPSTFANFSSYLSPWATGERLSRVGMAIMCEAESDDPSCLRDMARYTAQAPGARRADVALARHWLWFANAPKRFVIAIVPPRS
jgi:4-amino-4-deoxy-L-arabinose transferase-like glycosyltransferase